jgi:hypothetical protein
MARRARGAARRARPARLERRPGKYKSEDALSSATTQRDTRPPAVASGESPAGNASGYLVRSLAMAEAVARAFLPHWRVYGCETGEVERNSAVSACLTAAIKEFSGGAGSGSAPSPPSSPSCTSPSRCSASSPTLGPRRPAIQPRPPSLGPASPPSSRPRSLDLSAVISAIHATQNRALRADPPPAPSASWPPYRFGIVRRRTREARQPRPAHFA